MEVIMRRVLCLFGFFVVASLLFAQTAMPAGASYEIGYSPSGTSETLVLKAIKSAKSELLIACYEFTSRDIAAGVEAAAHRGVKVKIVADWKASKGKYSQIKILKAVGIPVRLDEKYAIMHNKFIVIDGTSVETGSFNYTDGAVKHNGKNVLVLWNVPDISKTYTIEWIDSRVNRSRSSNFIMYTGSS